MTDTLDSSVTLITGVMAAGKSTVAQALAERLPRAAHVRGDVFRRMVVSGRVEMGSPDETEALAQLRLRYRLSAMTADAYAAAGMAAIVQDIVIGAELSAYVGLVRTRPLYVVVLAPSAVEVARRDAAREKTGYGPHFAVAELDRGLREETPGLGLWLDTSGLTVDETVDEVLRRLPEARV
ncbi:AAA family ATPase [Streptomyces sp. NPDC057638]|uniref:AAA family ATPase n=1 Tax=Streptomyces sp. NPDC057638 TaxID=3346190 RepID=UPI0036A0B909